MDCQEFRTLIDVNRAELPPNKWDEYKAHFDECKPCRSIVYSQDLNLKESGEPIIRIASAIIMQAINQGASDIKLDTTDTELMVSYQVGGEWREEMRVPSYITSHLIERFRVMAGLKGEIASEMEEGTISVRVGSPLNTRDYTLVLRHTGPAEGGRIDIHIISREFNFVKEAVDRAVDQLFLADLTAAGSSDPKISDLINTIIEQAVTINLCDVRFEFGATETQVSFMIHAGGEVKAEVSLPSILNERLIAGLRKAAGLKGRDDLDDGIIPPIRVNDNTYKPVLLHKRTENGEEIFIRMDR